MHVCFFVHSENFVSAIYDVILTSNDVVYGIVSIVYQVFLLSTGIVGANDGIKLFVCDSDFTNQV